MDHDYEIEKQLHPENFCPSYEDPDDEEENTSYTDTYEERDN